VSLLDSLDDIFGVGSDLERHLAKRVRAGEAFQRKEMN
jgi:hypothetical protein